MFPESRLGPDPQMFADLRAGALEFFIAGRDTGRGRADQRVAVAAVRVPASSKAVFAALDGALGDRIRSELAQNGLHAFRHSLQNGFHHLTTSTRPIHTAADLAGVKIRSPGGEIAADFFATFGADAGYVPFSQMYDALKARGFDGQSDPLGVVLSLRLYEVQNYLSLTGHWWSGFTLLANAAAWAALPRDIQEVVERNAEKFALLQREDIEAINAAGAEELARRGMAVNTADTASFRAGSADFYARWREKAGPAAWRLLEILCRRDQRLTRMEVERLSARRQDGAGHRRRARDRPRRRAGARRRRRRAGAGQPHAEPSSTTVAREIAPAAARRGRCRSTSPTPPQCAPPLPGSARSTSWSTMPASTGRSPFSRSMKTPSIGCWPSMSARRFWSRRRRRG